MNWNKSTENLFFYIKTEQLYTRFRPLLCRNKQHSDCLQKTARNFTTSLGNQRKTTLKYTRYMDMRNADVALTACAQTIVMFPLNNVRNINTDNVRFVSKNVERTSYKGGLTVSLNDLITPSFWMFLYSLLLLLLLLLLYIWKILLRKLAHAIYRIFFQLQKLRISLGI